MHTTQTDEDRLQNWVVEVSGQAVSHRTEINAYVDAGARVAWDESGYFSAERLTGR
jgi:hypothetical protein